MRRVRFHSFSDASNPLALLSGCDQAIYLRHYLADLGAETIVEEPVYFDRDYLAEFAAFYSESSRPYVNRCRRLHFFAGPRVDRNQLRRAVGGSKGATRELQKRYLGFVVLRPIPSAPLGRTVVRWYPEQTPQAPRVTNPSREYECHLAGISLSVRGIAWQQQDSAVGACATIALWSMLHSSAFDDHHAIPTTAQITRRAHLTASLGDRVFPSAGLTIHQVCEAIKESGLAPVVLEGDEDGPDDDKAFGRERFSAACASLIRSSYPVLIVGPVERQGQNLGGHAVCAVGFREHAPSTPRPGHVDMQDGEIRHLYLHDDNIGPAARFEILDDPKGYVRLRPSPPPSQHSQQLPPSPSSNYPDIIPSKLVAALHEGIRTSPDRLHEVSLLLAQQLCGSHNALIPPNTSGGGIGLTISSRFSRLSEYVGEELGRLLSPFPAILARVRLALWESVEPMSLHVGIARIGIGSNPVMDVVYDTTDCDSNLGAFCCVVFDPTFSLLARALSARGVIQVGAIVESF